MSAAILLALLLAAPAPQPPQAAAPPAEVPLATPEQVLAFGQDDTRMTVPVTIAGTGPYRFIIDTGAERTVIARELAQQLRLARGRDVRITAMTGSSDVGTVVIPSIEVSTLGGERIEAPALDARNLGAAGLLGIDTLQGHAVAIDFDRQVMAVVPAARRRVRRVAVPDEIIIRAKSLYGQLVVTDAFYRGRRIRVILDTGSIVSMGNRALQRVVERTGKLRPIVLLSVTGQLLAADYTQIDAVKIGAVGLANLPVAFSDAAPFRRLGLTGQPALLLGMDALRLFRTVRIDFANREVRLALPRDAVRGRADFPGGGRDPAG